jgi:hypothetical protein
VRGVARLTVRAAMLHLAVDIVEVQLAVRFSISPSRLFRWWQTIDMCRRP